MKRLIEELLPFHRAQSGEGVRTTLQHLQSLVPLQIREVPSGTKASGWTVPPEWQINDAYVSYQGRRIIDYRDHNLHIVNGSVPFQGVLTWEDLAPRLTVGDSSNSIPYRTAFFRDSWGFCVRQSQFEELEALNGPFEVVVDTGYQPGSMSTGSLVIPGKLDSRIVFWAHTCHPCLANDNLSGVAVATTLANHLLARDNLYTYEFAFGPATIGAIHWISEQKSPANIVGGLVLSLLGDRSKFHYKQSRRGSSRIDHYFDFKFATASERPIGSVLNFEPFGYDERQFCSPGLNLPFGRLTRALPGEFPAYHTSKDDLELVQAESLAESLKVLLDLVDHLESEPTYRSVSPNCEPFLQDFDLYTAYGESSRSEFSHQALMWVLNLADGQHDRMAMSNRSHLPLDEIDAALDALVPCGLLQEVYA